MIISRFDVNIKGECVMCDDDKILCIKLKNTIPEDTHGHSEIIKVKVI